MKKLLLVCVAAVGLAGCPNPGGNSAIDSEPLSPKAQALDRLTKACKGYNALLKSLWAYREAGKLSEGQIRTINGWEPFLSNTCLNKDIEYTGVTDSMLDQLEKGMETLILIKSSKGG